MHAKNLANEALNALIFQVTTSVADGPLHRIHRTTSRLTIANNYPIGVFGHLLRPSYVNNPFIVDETGCPPPK